MLGFVVPARRAKELAGKFARRSLELVVSYAVSAPPSPFSLSLLLSFFFEGGGSGALEIEIKVLCMLGKRSTLELYSQTSLYYFLR